MLSSLGFADTTAVLPPRNTKDGTTMSKVCSICGKHPTAGRNVSHSHRVTNRMFHPNVQKVSAVVDGSVKKINVCTKCIKAGKITRA
jgi:large subunit ribosomal protein L28